MCGIFPAENNEGKDCFKVSPVKIAHCSVLTISFSVNEITNPSSDAQVVNIEQIKTITESKFTIPAIVSGGPKLYGQSK